MTGVPSTEELWELFWKYENTTGNLVYSAETRLAGATMARAISEMISAREFRTYRRPT